MIHVESLCVLPLCTAVKSLPLESSRSFPWLLPQSDLCSKRSRSNTLETRSGILQNKTANAVDNHPRDSTTRSALVLAPAIIVARKTEPQLRSTPSTLVLASRKTCLHTTFHNRQGFLSLPPASTSNVHSPLLLLPFPDLPLLDLMLSRRPAFISSCPPVR